MLLSRIRHSTVLNQASRTCGAANSITPSALSMRPWRTPLRNARGASLGVLLFCVQFTTLDSPSIHAGSDSVQRTNPKTIIDLLFPH